jgi:hypothetical protein
MIETESKHLGNEGEKSFSSLCDKLGCGYLCIDQQINTYSSEMWRNSEKRPDFFVNIPDIAPLFMEVKASERRWSGTNGILAQTPAFGIFYREFERMQNFENQIGISTWYAFFENFEGRIIPFKAHTIPLSRIEKQIPKMVLQELKNGTRDDWSIFIPWECMNEWNTEIELKNKCQGCTKKFCEMPK